MLQRFENFSLSMTEISKYWHRITADEMKKYNLRGSHATYLITLSRYPEGITATQLCELCSKDKSDVSRMVSMMEKNGLVKKEGVHQNLYRGVYKLTEEGNRAADHVRERAALAVEMAGQGLDDANRAIFYQVLGQIVRNLRNISKEGLPNHESSV